MALLDTEAKRFYAAIAGAAVIALALVATIFLLTRDGDERVGQDARISETEKVAARQVLENFFTDAGTWGLKTDTLTEDNLASVRYLIAINGPSAPTYWQSRNETYLALRDEYLLNGTPMWTSDGEVQAWVDMISRDSLSSFKTVDVEVQPIEDGSWFMVQGEQVKSVTIDVNYSVVQTRYNQSSTDSSWDGTFIVDEKRFDDSASVILIQINDSWRLYDLRGNEFPFVLASWLNPDQDYYDSQFDFVETGRIKTDPTTGTGESNE